MLRKVFKSNCGRERFKYKKAIKNRQKGNLRQGKREKMTKEEKRNTAPVQQIIDRILAQNFNVNKPGCESSGKSIEDIENEILSRVIQNVKVIDFAKGETCEFK